MTSFDVLFWVVGFLNNVFLFGVLVTKQRAHRFPVFTSLISLYISRTIALFFIHRSGSHAAYYNTYWVLAFVDIALQLAVLYEAASKVFSPGGQWAPGIRRTFLRMIAASLAVAAALTWLYEPHTKTLLDSITQRGNFFASILVSELFVGMIFLSVTTGLPLRTHVARIVQGLGISAIVGIVLEALQTYFGRVRSPGLYDSLSHIQIVTNFAVQLFLIVALAREAPEPRALPAQLYRQLLHLNDQTDRALAYLKVGRRTS
jgi:hypothetical protein